FKCKETEKIWYGEHSRKLPTNLQMIAKRKLRMLNNVTTLTEIQKVPSNMLEKLKGDRQGQYSIRINNQWRICFKWVRNSAIDVAIEDYH
ncbi:plasmid maintenance system killer, partial [Genlisea aurea]